MAKHGLTMGERLAHLGWDVTEGECWEWRGYRNGGYGRIRVAGRSVLAHRVSYETWVGPIPAGMQVRHRCDNPPCINPAHLEVGTHLDNMHDMHERGRRADLSGERHGRAKLTWPQVQEIRALVGKVTQRELARRFGVSKGTIHYISKNEHWREPQEVGVK